MNTNKIVNHNYGIDILRIISMFSIVGLHVFGHGGILPKMEVGSLNSCLLQVVYTFFICSVDVFAMITGYLYVGKEKVKSRNIVELVLSVIFYCVVITIVVALFFPELYGRKMMYIESLLPPIGDRYWVCA